MALADIKTGYSCNNNCVHCVVKDQLEKCVRKGLPTDRSTAEYTKEIEESVRKGARKIVITGGEPTIRPDMLFIMQFCHDRGLMVELQTNGRMFYYADFCEGLAGFGAEFVIALHGKDAETHEKISRAKGSFAQTEKGIANLIGLGEKVIGKTVISTINCRDLKGITQKFVELGVREFCFAFPHGNGNARKYFREVVPRYSEVKRAVLDLIAYVEGLNQKEKRYGLKLEMIPPCLLEGNIKYNLEMMNAGCGFVELKQLADSPVDWDYVRPQNKVKLPRCRECRYDVLCEGPWKEYPEYYGQEEFVPIK